MNVMIKAIEISLNQKITTKKDQPLILNIAAESKEIRILGIMKLL
jgi:hypothetical protein